MLMPFSGAKQPKVANQEMFILTAFEIIEAFKRFNNN